MNTDGTMIDATDAPHGGRRAVTIEEVHEQNAQILAQNAQILTQLANVVEFVDTIKGIGAQAARGGGVQAMMLRNMVPGIENLAG